MILGVGVDIVHLPRIIKLTSRSGLLPFARRILSPKEHEEFFRLFPNRTDSDTGILHDRQLQYLGSRWCIKEAVYKALYPIGKLQWKQVTVEKDKGKPTLSIDNASMYGISRSHVSLSHDGEYAIAMVVLEKI
ncbi:4'-phosphopantetheinyl transferase [Chlamydoabsidia padenii]|nr:4'-phosphopantetheinyl transferase [Chlamydoabsidia padenii]